jgi:HK97 family phage major capsid protein
MSLARELREKRGQLVADAQALIPANGLQMAVEVRTKFDAIMVEVDALKADIDRVERAEALAIETRAVRPPEAQVDSRTEAAKTADLEQRAFATYVRRGINAVKEDAELRTYVGLNIGTGSQGDFTVPTGFQKELETKMKAYGGILQAARILNTSAGNPIQWPTADDTTNKGRWLTEATTVTQTNPSFGQITLGANLASSDQVLISVQLLQDSAFDFQGLLSDMFAIRLGRLVNDAYTTGSGSGQPQGIVGVSSIGNVTAVGDPQTGNTASNSVGYDDLNNVQFAVDAAYRQNGTYMFSDATFQAIRKLKDSLGRPLWQVSLAEGVPDKLLNKPYIVNYSMANIGSTNKSVRAVAVC